MRESAPSGELLIALPTPCEPVKAVRSTLILSSYTSLVAEGHVERYFTALAAEHHAAVKNAVAGAWLPADVANAHYAACSSLGLSHDAVVRLGRAVGQKVNGTLLGTAVRMAKEMGVSPLTVVPQFPRFWGRAFQGGGICAFKTGPKEVRFEMHNAAVIDYPYFRSAICGLLMGMLEPVCQRVYMIERPGPRAPGMGIFRLQWV